VVSLTITVVVLSGSVVLAQDVNHEAAPLESNAGGQTQGQQSKSDDELFDDTVAETVDRPADEKPSLESTQIETLDDIDAYPVEYHGEVTGHDAASEFDNPDELESASKDRHAADQQQQAEFPPPFDHSTIDASAVAQVAGFVVLICHIRMETCDSFIGLT